MPPDKKSYTYRLPRHPCCLWQCASALLLTLSLLGGQVFAQQLAILGAASASDRAVIFPEANLSNRQYLMPSFPSGAMPHGVAYFGSDQALISDLNHSRVFVIRLSTATLLSTIETAPTYEGGGTIAVAPSLTAALAMGNSPFGSQTLNVVRAPFGSNSTITPVTLPGRILAFQTQAIVFDNAGRAFVYNTSGISVLNSPYTSIAFHIPMNGNSASGAIAISPDGNTLLTTDLSTNRVRIFQAPFSASSTPSTLTIPGGTCLDGIMVTPDGTRAVVVSAYAHHAASIAAPFGSSSVVETLPLPPGTSGFEDVGISADGQVAILTGNSSSEPPVFIKAPFTTGGAVSSTVPIMGVTNPGRGNGAVRFLPPGLAPGLTISQTAPATIISAANLTYSISYGNSGTASATSVVIRDPLPAGTSFVSATNGGRLVDGKVFFDIGSVSVGTAGVVSFTVTVNSAPGETVENNNYTIEGDGISPIPGPPVTTSVSGGQQTVPASNRVLNLSTRLRIERGDNVLIGGIIITGDQSKTVLARSLGPSLSDQGLAGVLADPVLELRGAGGTLIASNDNWKDAQRAQIEATGFAPSRDAESALVAMLSPGAYTLVVRGVADTTGLALVELYDLAPEVTAKLANISARGLIQTGDNVIIGGFIIGAAGSGQSRVVIRAVGPTLGNNGVPGALQDTTLELYDANGVIGSNDNWRSSQENEIAATGLAPADNREAAILANLPPGGYTAIVRGKSDSTGVGLLEVYNLD